MSQPNAEERQIIKDQRVGARHKFSKLEPKKLKEVLEDMGRPTTAKDVSTLLREVEDAGFKIVEQQRPFEWQQFRLAGHIDAKIAMNEKDTFGR